MELFNRRTALRGALAVAATPLAAGVASADVGATAFKEKWGPNPGVDGLKAFVGIEDDRSNSHPSATHIFAESDQYRFVMHKSDRDGSDRQRNEVRAIQKSGSRQDMKKGETWRFNYQMFMPTSLKGTTSFSHIFQIKHTAVASPVITVSLFRSGSAESIELRLFGAGQAKLGSTPLAPLRNKWIDVEIEVKVADGSGGRARFSLKDGPTTVVNATRSGIDMWLGGDQAHPKWGIYRSINDSAQLQDTYLLLRNMKAYRDE
ncbi:Tat pathway signal sequence domain protein [Lentzea sp. NPDC051838]|uniref:Tat pathway signal sequence domain protein n=1 Tax=Lentzea sp. NPDC051838 TaxID=3154849 RepID=UPI00343B8DC8